jgi:hypothetical protein
MARNSTIAKYTIMHKDNIFRGKNVILILLTSFVCHSLVWDGFLTIGRDIICK